MRRNTIQISDKTYHVICPEEKESNLIDAAILLNEKISDIQNNHRTHKLEQIAIMVALNLANDLLIQNNQNKTNFTTTNKHLTQLHNKIELILTIKNTSSSCI